MIGRNVDDHFAKTPTPHFPRSRFDMGIHKRLQTQGHGRLYPFFCRMVYPGDTWQMDMSTFVRMDTSVRVPLDDIYLDTYWFFVPLRILDEDFPKVLGEGEPSDYDDVSYAFPELVVEDSTKFNINNILPYLGYNQLQVTANNDGTFSYFADDTINPYPLAAVYKVYNDWFRDENVDPSIPFKDLYNSDTDVVVSDSLFDNLNCLKVNRYHDYFASAVIAPQKGPAVTIPLGTSAPVGFVGTSDVVSLAAFNYPILGAGEAVYKDKFVQYHNASSQDNSPVSAQGVIADLSAAAGTINELRLAFAIQALYERRGRYGTRYIETIRGQWGIEVPDSFFLRPEYLGGNRVTLNNVPVLSTENSSQLGQMSGNSATLSNGGSWSKTFIEYGVLLGVSCTRIKHSYAQGLRKELWSLKTQLDLYNPVFANIGMQPVLAKEIANDPSDPDNDIAVFAYQEAWADLRSDTDSFAGLFGSFSTNNDIKNKWHYGDYYNRVPVFSASWLKEPFENVARTLTGQLINGAASTESEGHQFMFGYYYHPIVTRILPSHSVPVELIGRL